MFSMLSSMCSCDAQNVGGGNLGASKIASVGALTFPQKGMIVNNRGPNFTFGRLLSADGTRKRQNLTPSHSGHRWSCRKMIAENGIVQTVQFHTTDFAVLDLLSVALPLFYTHFLSGVFFHYFIGSSLFRFFKLVGYFSPITSSLTSNSFWFKYLKLIHFKSHLVGNIKTNASVSRKSFLGSDVQTQRHSMFADCLLRKAFCLSHSRPLETK